MSKFALAVNAYSLFGGSTMAAADRDKNRHGTEASLQATRAWSASGEDVVPIMATAPLLISFWVANSAWLGLDCVSSSMSWIGRPRIPGFPEVDGGPAQKNWP